MPISKLSTGSPVTLLIFPSELGWMAVVIAGAAVRQLTFGHSSAAAAKKALDPRIVKHAKPGKPGAHLACRLRAYASGNPADFRDIPMDLGSLSRFRRRVLNQCRRIPYGSLISYAELAARVGFPRAARAVGNCLAANRIPLIVPCHRVVRSDGRIGSYSAPGGRAMKRQLVALELRNWPRIQ